MEGEQLDEVVAYISAVCPHFKAVRLVGFVVAGDQLQMPMGTYYRYLRELRELGINLQPNYSAIAA